MVETLSHSCYNLVDVISGVQSNLSILDSKTVLIIEVSLFQRFIYTHLYCRGPLLTIIIIEVSLFQSIHNSRFDCSYK